MRELPSKPPHDDEEPEDEDEEDDIPKPPTSLSFGHVVHPSERALEDVASLCEGVVLFKRACTQDKRLGEVKRKVRDAPFG